MYIIYSKPDCPYCKYAKQLLDLHDIEYDQLTLGEDFSRDEFLLMFEGHKTYPLIMKQDGDEFVYIGGYDQLEEHLEDIL